jgi:hypothetical protein
MQLLWEAAEFVRALRKQMRFGELSRAPLRMQRFELRGEFAECDWLARPADPWDAVLPRRLGETNASEQALRDAIAVREFLFYALPTAESAMLRAFRESSTGELEMIIAGTVVRGREVYRHMPSLAMRAKLLGFQFWTEDGVLESLRSQECAMSL